MAEDKPICLAELSSARCTFSNSLLEDVSAAVVGRHCLICKDFIFSLLMCFHMKVSERDYPYIYVFLNYLISGIRIPQGIYCQGYIYLNYLMSGIYISHFSLPPFPSFFPL